MKFDYIFFDKNAGTVSVNVPLASGDFIGLDNTCQSGVAMQGFFYSRTFESQYRTILEEIVQWMIEGIRQGESKAEVRRREGCLETLNSYYKRYMKIINESITEGVLKRTWREKYFHTRTPLIPPQVIKTIKVDPYIGAIRLDPKYRHDFERFNGAYNCSFGIKRGEGTEVAIFKDTLGKWLEFNLNKLQKSKQPGESDKSWKDNLIKGLKETMRSYLSELPSSSKVTDELEVPITKKVACLLLQKAYESLNLHFKEIKSVHDPEKIIKMAIIDEIKKQEVINSIKTQQEVYKGFAQRVKQEGLSNEIFFDYLTFIYPDACAYELIEALENYLQLKGLVIYPESNVMRTILEDNSGFCEEARHFTQDPIARINLAIQFFIGVTNSYLIAQGKVPQTVNFGHVIEGIESQQGQKYFDEDKHMVSSLLKSLDNNSPEEFEGAILSWINDNKASFSLTSDITTEDKENISELFLGCFNTVKSIEHWDEFIIRVPDKGSGLWKSKNGHLVIDFEYLCQHGFGLHPEEADHFAAGPGDSSKLTWSYEDVMEVGGSYHSKLLEDILKCPDKEAPWYRHICNQKNLEKISKVLHNNKVLVKSYMGLPVHSKEITSEDLSWRSMSGGRSLLIHAVISGQNELIQQILSCSTLQNIEKLKEYLSKVDDFSNTALGYAVELGCNLEIIDQLWRLTPLTPELKFLDNILANAVKSKVYDNFNYLLSETKYKWTVNAYGYLIVELSKYDLSGDIKKCCNRFFNHFLEGSDIEDDIRNVIIKKMQLYFNRARLLRDQADQQRQSRWAKFLWSLVNEQSDNADFILKLFAEMQCSFNWLEQGSTKTLLMHVAQFGMIEKIEFLIQNRAYVNQVDSHGDSVLMYAVKSNQQEAVKILLQNGADVSIKNREGKKAIDLVADQDANEVKKLLGVCEKYSSSKHESERVALLDEHKDLLLNMYLHFFQGYSLLTGATRYLERSVVIKLVELGFDINKVDRNGRSALEVAIDMGSKFLINYFLSREGVDCNIRSKEKYNMLFHYVINGCRSFDEGVMDLLLKSGINDREECYGKDIIAVALDCNNAHALGCLLNRLPDRGITLLLSKYNSKLDEHSACINDLVKHVAGSWKDSLSFIRPLVENIKLRDSSQDEALYNALRFGNIPLVKFLEENNAKLKCSSQRRYNKLLKGAVDSNNIETFEYLSKLKKYFDKDLPCLLRKLMRKKDKLPFIEFVYSKIIESSDPLHKIYFSCSALTFSAEIGNLEYLKYFLKKKSHVSRQIDEACRIAATRDRHQCVYYLLSEGLIDLKFIEKLTEEGKSNKKGEFKIGTISQRCISSFIKKHGSLKRQIPSGELAASVAHVGKRYKGDPSGLGKRKVGGAATPQSDAGSSNQIDTDCRRDFKLQRLDGGKPASPAEVGFFATLPVTEKTADDHEAAAGPSKFQNGGV